MQVLGQDKILVGHFNLLKETQMLLVICVNLCIAGCRASKLTLVSIEEFRLPSIHDSETKHYQPDDSQYINKESIIGQASKFDQLNPKSNLSLNKNSNGSGISLLSNFLTKKFQKEVAPLKKKFMTIKQKKKLLGFKVLSSPRVENHRHLKSENIDFNHKFAQKQVVTEKKRKIKELTEHENRLKREKLVPCYDQSELQIDPYELTRRALSNFPLESKYAIRFLASIMDKKEKREIMHYDQIYYYYFEEERHKIFNYQLVLKPQHHLAYRYEIVKIISDPENKKAKLIGFDHKFKKDVIIDQVTDQFDKNLAIFYEKNAASKIQVKVNPELRNIYQTSYLDQLHREIVEHDLSIGVNSKDYNSQINYRRVMYALQKQENIDQLPISAALDFFNFRGESFMVVDKYPLNLNRYIKQYGAIDNLLSLRKVAVMLIRNLIYLSKPKIQHYNLNLKSVAIEIDEFKNIEKCILHTFNEAHIYYNHEEFNQTKDIKALGYMLLRLKIGHSQYQSEDEDLKNEFNSWKGAVDEQGYDFIDFIGVCLAGKQKFAINLMKKNWIQGLIRERRHYRNRTEQFSLMSTPVIKRPPIAKRIINNNSRIDINIQ
ncbi:UNKNOWN [Stylonychia lemnae]|uniref:Protein kinase domain-containing protein n=1 Tax=Stylonychia lemnae TaxID=5949 RepID=A0A078ADZ1_STYLE|nr:UNKNOWN [Stylonychia lemnae]|eukprot:CDW80066.1 UNKNOWN [Stylonychia lemnae]